MLLYLANWARPDIASAVRVGELADLRQELTYLAFRRRKALQRNSRRQEYRVAYTAASWLTCPRR